MNYSVRLSKLAVKAVAKLDVGQRRIIYMWIAKNLANCPDPRVQGKALDGALRGLWRYRVGDYRLLAKIQDKELLILIVNIGHRSKIYQQARQDDGKRQG
jgi:mRNA interferase RelE/StbE